MAIKEVIDMRAMDLVKNLTTGQMEDLLYQERPVADRLGQMFDDWLRQMTIETLVVICVANVTIVPRCACGSPLRADKSIELGECEACRAKHRRH